MLSRVSALLVVCILVIGGILTACTSPTTLPAEATLPSEVAADGEGVQRAEEALLAYFSLLNEGKYEEAVPYYGGSYEVLRGYNPDVPAEEYATLLEYGCRYNGLNCLAVGKVVESEAESSSTYRFLVEFANQDGTVFTQGPCCGATEEESPLQTQFPITVVEIDDQFLVQELPPYTP